MGELVAEETAQACEAVAAILLLGLGSLAGDMDFHFQASAWGPILGLILSASVLGMFGLFKGMELIGPTRASILSMVEPVVTAGLGVLLLHQMLNPLQILGGLAVIGGAALVSMQTPS